jgi:hypothetical protein
MVNGTSTEIINLNVKLHGVTQVCVWLLLTIVVLVILFILLLSWVLRKKQGSESGGDMMMIQEQYLMRMHMDVPSLPETYVKNGSPNSDMLKIDM